MTNRTLRSSAHAVALFAAALLGTAAAAQAVPEGARKIAVELCAACHGETGNSAVAMFPRLAGMQAEYTAKQLNDYLGGKRQSAVMTPVLANIKAADVVGLAAYYAAQTPPAATPADASLAAAGKQLFEAGNAAGGVPGCIGCHQAGAGGNARYPRLARQHAQYTADQLTQFKGGARANDKARVMRSIALRMTEQDIAAVSAYLEGL